MSVRVRVLVLALAPFILANKNYDWHGMMKNGSVTSPKTPKTPNSGFPLSGLLNKIPLGGYRFMSNLPRTYLEEKTFFPPFSNLVLDVFHRRRADLRGVCVCVCVAAIAD